MPQTRRSHPSGEVLGVLQLPRHLPEHEVHVPAHSLEVVRAQELSLAERLRRLLELQRGGAPFPWRELPPFRKHFIKGVFHVKAWWG